MVGESIPAPCIVCGEPSRAACPRCKTRYCSKRCQGADWRESHREECSRIARGATPRRGPLPPPPPPTDAVIACPRCHEAIDGATVYYSCCCARVCAACDDAFYETGSDDCALCGTELPATAAESLARTKKWADAGHAAATYELAALYATGDAEFGVDRRRALALLVAAANGAAPTPTAPGHGAARDQRPPAWTTGTVSTTSPSFAVPASRILLSR
ncbi:hypothetical protein JL720_16702 [Aureococcus anophagefferens]|nr:hypothetical protein JL720_16702 [Aureococcus anophagefferens]